MDGAPPKSVFCEGICPSSVYYIGYTPTSTADVLQRSVITHSPQSTHHGAHLIYRKCLQRSFLILLHRTNHDLRCSCSLLYFLVLDRANIRHMKSLIVKKCVFLWRGWAIARPSSDYNFVNFDNGSDNVVGGGGNDDGNNDNFGQSCFIFRKFSVITALWMTF